MDAAVGIRQLRNHLSAVLRRVKKGQSVTITDRRRAVAVLMPSQRSEAEELLARAASSGALSWQGGKPAGCARPSRVSSTSVAEAVIEDRR